MVQHEVQQEYRNKICHNTHPCTREQAQTYPHDTEQTFNVIRLTERTSHTLSCATYCFAFRTDSKSTLQPLF